MRAMGGIGLFDKKSSKGQQKMEHESVASIHGLKDVSGVTKGAGCICTELDQFSRPLNWSSSLPCNYWLQKGIHDGSDDCNTFLLVHTVFALRHLAQSEFSCTLNCSEFQTAQIKVATSVNKPNGPSFALTTH